MARKTVYVRGYCPYLDCTHSIEATYAKYSFLGDPATYAKCLNVYCNYADDCNQVESCPIFRSAQSRSLW